MAERVSRGAAALIGFQLNGRITFAASGNSRLGARRLLRFAALWTGLTVTSTLLMVACSRSMPANTMYVAKPVVEVVLAAVSFLLSRQ